MQTKPYDWNWNHLVTSLPFFFGPMTKETIRNQVRAPFSKQFLVECRQRCQTKMGSPDPLRLAITSCGVACSCCQ